MDKSYCLLNAKKVKVGDSSGNRGTFSYGWRYLLNAFTPCRARAWKAKTKSSEMEALFKGMFVCTREGVEEEKGSCILSLENTQEESFLVTSVFVCLCEYAKFY